MEKLWHDHSGYLDHWLPIWVDNGYLYLVTVATHIGYIFYCVQTCIKRVLRQQLRYMTVTHCPLLLRYRLPSLVSRPSYRHTVIADNYPIPSVRVNLRWRLTQLPNGKIDDWSWLLIISISSAAMARPQDRISHTLHFLIDNKFSLFLIWHPVTV